MGAPAPSQGSPRAPISRAKWKFCPQRQALAHLAVGKSSLGTGSSVVLVRRGPLPSFGDSDTGIRLFSVLSQCKHLPAAMAALGPWSFASLRGCASAGLTVQLGHSWFGDVQDTPASLEEPQGQGQPSLQPSSRPPTLVNKPTRLGRRSVCGRASTGQLLWQEPGRPGTLPSKARERHIHGRARTGVHTHAHMQTPPRGHGEARGRGAYTSLPGSLRTRNSVAQMQSQNLTSNAPFHRRGPRTAQVKRLLGGNYAVA